MRLGLSLGVGMQSGASATAAAIITATVAPAIQSVTDGDTWADLLLASATDPTNYDSTESVNDPTPVAEVQIDGGAWTALSGNETTVLNAGETVAVRVTVTDDDTPANERVFGAGSTDVAGIAPTVTASDSLATRTLTITRDTLTGTPTPAVALTTLTLDGVDVSGDATETVTGEEWTYEVPSSASSQTVAWEITATNPGGSDTASGSEAVAADWIAPTWTVSLGSVVDGQTVGIPSSGADVEAVLGGSAGAPDDPLTWEISVDGGAYASLATPYTAGAGEELVIRISDSDHPAGAFSATSAPVTVTAAPTAPVLSSVTLTDSGGGVGTMTLTFDSGETSGTSVDVWGYIDNPGDTDPADGAAVAAGIGGGAEGEFSVTTTVGASGVSVSITGTLDGTYDVFVTASYDGGSTYSNVVSDTGVAFDTDAPTVSYSPADDATDVAIDTNLVMTFSEAMDPTAGSITLRTGGSPVETIASTSAVWASGDTVATFDPSSDLSNSTGYAVQYSGFSDANANPLPAVSDDTTWNFTTVAAAGTAGSADVDGGTASTTTNDSVDGGSASVTTNDIIDGLAA